MVELNTGLLVELGGWPALKEARGLCRAREGYEFPAGRPAPQRARPGCGEKPRRADRAGRTHLRRRGALHLPGVAAQRPGLRARARGRPGGGSSPRAGDTARQATAAPVARRAAGRAPLAGRMEAPAECSRGSSSPSFCRSSCARRSGRIRFASFSRRARAARRSRGMRSSRNCGTAMRSARRTTVRWRRSNVRPTRWPASPRFRVRNWGAFLHALGGHPRVWSGKKVHIEIRASAERPRLLAELHDDGALELRLEGQGAPAAPAAPLPGWSAAGRNARPKSRSRRRLRRAGTPPGAARGACPSSSNATGPRWRRRATSIFRRVFDSWPRPAANRREARRLARRPDARTGGPLWRARVSHRLESRAGRDGDLSRSARPLTASGAAILASEKQAAIAVQAAGFAPVRSGGRAFSLATERHVARFLANTLPRWRREWTVESGPAPGIDLARDRHRGAERRAAPRGFGRGLAEPRPEAHASAASRSRSTRRRSSAGSQTGQSHARTADSRVLLVPTEAWCEMQEVLADCAVEQEPGRMRVARTFAPYLAGALDGAGFSRRAQRRGGPSAARRRGRAGPCARRAAAALPGGGRGVAGGARAAQRARPAGRRHGPRQDAAGARLLRAGCARRGERSRAGAGRLPHQPRRRTGCAKRRGSRRTCARSISPAPDRAERRARNRSEPIWSSPPTPSCAATWSCFATLDFRPRRARRGAAHQESRQPECAGREDAARAPPADPHRHAAGEFGARSLVALRFPPARLSRHRGRFPRTLRNAAHARRRDAAAPDGAPAPARAAVLPAPHEGGGADRTAAQARASRRSAN